MGYFCDWILQQLLADPHLGKTVDERKALIYGGGLRVRTTLDRTVQAATEQAVRTARGSRAALATAVVQPGSGKVLAMAASVPFGVSKGASSVNLPLGGSSGFQAGSTFKVFVLTQALKNDLPLSYTLHAPQTYSSKQFAKYNYVPGKGYQPYVVSNASDSEAGDFTLEEATWHSVNTYFIQLEERVGLDGPADVAESLGVRRSDGKPLERVPSFTLGVNEVSPLAMSAAYAAYAAHGRYCSPLGINAISQGHSWLSRSGPSCTQAVDRKVADTVTHVLQGVMTKGTGRAAQIGSDAAGKTGTVDNYSAAWFAGYTPHLAAAVWMGDPRGGFGHPLTNITVGGRYYPRMYGGQLPAQTWAKIMRGARSGSPHFALQLLPQPTCRPTSPDATRC
jgi:membrane peptidoglycan carboxypeptidase